MVYQKGMHVTLNRTRGFLQQQQHHHRGRQKPFARKVFIPPPVPMAESLPAQPVFGFGN
jgi:hypothetical protein